MNKLNVWTRQSHGVESIGNDPVLLIQGRFRSFNRESFRDAQTFNLFIHTSLLKTLILSKRRSAIDTTIVGEVGLGGEVRSVPRLEQRLKEAIHMGFKLAIVPKHSLKGVSDNIKKQIELLPVEMVEEAIEKLLA